MKRRTFLQTGLIGGLIATRARGLEPPAAGAVTQAFELDEVPVATLQEGMRSGRWTARRLTELYLERIDAIDRRGPALASVIETNPEAIRIAETLDQERRSGQSRGPLHGIPVLIKDNIDTGDRMETTAGSLALTGSRAPRDAFIVERLRAAGAVLLGKTNLSEWANFRGWGSSSGWSGKGGQTRNPYALDRSPCGSSSGSGAAAAASLAAVTIGTETNGSIVCPSSANGLAGLKPTVGLWSRAGIIPISATQDTAGPMGRTVADLAALLGPLAAVDPRDPATAAARSRAGTDYVAALDPGALRGARLGVARKGFNVSARVIAVFDEAVAALRSAGATVIDPADLPSLADLESDELELFRYELKAGLEAYLASRPDQPHRSLRDLIAFNQRNRERELRFFGQEHLEDSAGKAPLTDPKYRAIRRRLLAVTRGNFSALLARHRLDAVVCPTGGPAWVIDPVNGDHFTGGDASYPAITGYPHLTVPMGQVHGLPVGLSFFGPAWSEARLLGFGHAFERATQVRAAPRFVPTVPATG